MSVAIANNFLDRIASTARGAIKKIEALEERGFYTREDCQWIDAQECTWIPAYKRSAEMAAERDGKRLCYSTFTPDARSPLDAKGLYLSNAGARPEIYVYGIIGQRNGGITAEDFQSKLAGIDRRSPIDLHVHSPGGDYDDGVAIYSLIRSRPGAVYGFVDAKAYSAASVILMACKTITMAPGAKIMIHGAALRPQGSWEQAEIEAALAIVKATNAQLVEFYAPRWNGSRAELEAALMAETYYNAEQAIAMGLADNVLESVKVAALATVGGYAEQASFSISACEGPHKRFAYRKAMFKLWELAADEMRPRT